jgi:nucleoid-associated protein YgaU
MPPLAFNRPAAAPAATAPGVPPVRPTAAVPAVTPAPVVAADATPPTSPTSATAGPREHVVASGETLSSIAARFLGSESRWAEIAKANPGVNPNSMRVGTKLAIPSVASGSPSAGTRTASASDYVVKAGDTLTGIARQTMGSADWESIYEANRSVIGANPAALRVGMRLSIPKRS